MIRARALEALGEVAPAAPTASRARRPAANERGPKAVLAARRPQLHLDRQTVRPPPSQKSFAVSVLASTSAFICVLSSLSEFLQASFKAASVFTLHCAL